MPPLPLRVGSVPYLVGRPLDDGLERESGIEYSRRVPAELVEGLRGGALDVALVSSIELFRQPGYRYLAGLAIAGRGAVGSVQLFLRKPLAGLRTIALDPASRTAAALVQVLLTGQPLRFEECARGVDPRSLPADAWLRIGDAALRETLADDAPPVFNPSEAWCARTRLPFVFAAWAVRPGAELGEVAEALAEAKRRGLARVAQIAYQEAVRLELDAAFCRRYLTNIIRFDLGPAELAGLRWFHELTAEIGLAPKHASLAFYPTAELATV